MNYEEKGKKAEQTPSPEGKAEKKLSLSEIDELLKKSKKVSDNLDKFSKDDLFKKVDFYDKVEFKDKLNDEYDSVAYEKADFWKKFENFTRFGFHKERYGLLKSKERGLLDKTKINKKNEGIDLQIVSENKTDGSIGRTVSKEKFDYELSKIKRRFSNAPLERFDTEFDTIRTMTERYEVIDGEIVKIIRSQRTESGAVKAAGKMRKAEISRLETVNGAELTGLKDAMERNAKSKESFLKLGESMSDEEREKVTAKLDEEENQTKEKIKEKEERLSEETKKFREPLEGRLQETLEIQNSLTEAFDFIKTGESNLNKQTKNYESFIKEAQKLDLLGGVGGDVIKIFEDKKAVLDAQAKEFAERKELVSSKLEIIKNNKKEIEATLSRINEIGKTKQEIGKDKKEDKKEKKTWDETRDEVWGLKNTMGKKESQKIGKTFDELFPTYDYPGRKKEKKQDERTTEEERKEQNEAKVEEEIEVEENEEVAEKIFTKEEIAEIALKELKVLGIMGIKDRTMREQITDNVIMAVEAMIAKSKESVEENDIKKEVKDWYKKFTKNNSKKGKQPKK